MLVQFCVPFMAANGDGAYGYAILEKDLAFAPSTEMEFSHPVFEKNQKPLSVTYNIDKAEFEVMFASVLFNPHNESWRVSAFASEGWTVDSRVFEESNS